MENSEVAEIVGISEAHASVVWNKYKKTGKGDIAKKTRGRRIGECKVLMIDQEREIQKIMMDFTFLIK
jgi:transposase